MCAEFGSREALERLGAFREMFSHSGAWYEGDDDDPYAVVIVVCDRRDDDGEEKPFEQDAIEAALSSLLRMLALYGIDENASFRLEAWTQNRIRKLVKRAHGSKWRRVAAYLAEEGVCGGLASSNGASAICFAPMRLSEQPKALKQLQVSGLVLSEKPEAEVPEGDYLSVVLDEDIAMSTGKAIAQAGHALQLAFRQLPDDDFTKWAASGFLFHVERAPLPDAACAVEVRDAGFTEVAPGSRTAVAWLENRA